jgi:hypothetical protein
MIGSDVKGNSQEDAPSALMYPSSAGSACRLCFPSCAAAVICASGDDAAVARPARPAVANKMEDFMM